MDLRRYGWNSYIIQVDTGLTDELAEDPAMTYNLIQASADSKTPSDHSPSAWDTLERTQSSLIVSDAEQGPGRLWKRVQTTWAL
jgi:hypothetical protein